MAYSETQSFGKGKNLTDWKNIKTTISIFPISTWLKNLHEQATDGLMLSAVFRLLAISRPLKAKKQLIWNLMCNISVNYITLACKAATLAKTRFQLPP